MVASFTIDVIEIGGRAYEKIGGPAYYSGLTLKMLGFDPIVITALGGNGLRRIRELLSAGNKPQDLDVVDTDPSCDSIYAFHHVYTSTGRSSKILEIGCRIRMDNALRDIPRDSSWILVSPVFREIHNEDLRKISPAKNIALDLQGYAREIDGQKVISSLNNIERNIRGLPRVGIIHLSSDDIRDASTNNHKNDLEKISFLASKADIITYTIGVGGGYLGLIASDQGDKHKEPESGRIAWYYIPIYSETDGGDPTGCGDIFLASMVSNMAMNHSIIDAAVRASIISGMRVSRGFPIKVNRTEVENIVRALKEKVYRVMIA